MNKVFAVILNWNREKDTIDCLKSLRKIDSSGFSFSIVIVDNASKKSSLNKIEDFAKDFKNTKVIRNSENLGFAGGNNIGIRYALKNKADYIVVLNNDTRVDRQFLKIMIKLGNKYKSAGILCPKIYFEKGYEFHKKRYKENQRGKVFWAAGGLIDWENVYAQNRGVDEVDKGQYKRFEVVDFASGACMLIKSEVFKKVGIFDEKYFLYLEDTDFCLRASKKGFKTYYSPKSRIWHKVSQSSAIGSELNDYFTTRNRLYFGMIYAPLRSKIALIKESLRLLLGGRKWQKVGVKDFYLGIYGRGSWR